MSIYRKEKNKNELLSRYLNEEDLLRLPEGSLVAIPDDESSSWALSASEDKWEEEVIGKPVLRFTLTGRLSRDTESGLADLVKKLREEYSTAYLLSRLPAHETSSGIMMQNAGFQVIEALLQFRVSTEKVNLKLKNPTFVIRKGDPSDIDKCLNFIIGRVSSRYYVDPLLGERYERRAYYSWLSNTVAGRENILVAVKENKTVGFCSWQELGGKIARIGLIATDPEMPKFGIGSLLLSECADRCREAGIREIQLGTSILNIGAQSFYLKYGFQPIDHILTYRMAW